MNEFRPINQADYAAVARVIREASIGPARHFGIARDDCPVHPSLYNVERLGREIAGGRGFYVLEREGRIVGCVAMRMEEGGTLELSRLAIDVGEQGEGKGRELLERAILLGKEQGAERVKIFVFAGLASLVEWFERRGFFLTDTFSVNDVPTALSTMIRPICQGVPRHMRLLRRGDERILERFLLDRADSSAILLSNLRRGGIVDEGKARQATYLGGFEGEKLVGVISMAWNGNLLPQAPVMLDELARTMAAISPRGIEGVLGLEDQVERVVQVLSLPRGRHEAVLMDSREHLYGLSISEMKVPRELREGLCRCRRLEARDVPVLTDWMVDFNVESLNRRLSRKEVESNLLGDAEERDNRWVLESDEGLVATTGFNAATAEVVQVGGVYTPPELRSRHYARCAVAGSLLEAQANGVGRCVLFTARGNAPAQRAYEALGFSRVGDFWLILYRRVVSPTLIVPAF